MQLPCTSNQSLFLLVCLFFSTSTACSTLPKEAPPVTPWLTGPLLAPLIQTIPPGDMDLEFYLAFTAVTGTYQSNWHATTNASAFYNTTLTSYAWIGLTSFMDFKCVPSLLYQWCQQEHSCHVGDMPVAFDFTLLNKSSAQNPFGVDAIFSLNATVPLGKYNNLNPRKLQTDSTGHGSWFPGATLSGGKLVQVAQEHFLSPKFAISYLFGTPVSVKNLSSYGGGKGTRGTVYPGNVLFCDLSFEYTFTQNWVFALDIVYEHNNNSRFSRKKRQAPRAGLPSSDQFSLAPAIEYNFSSQVGILGGGWFTIAGRNAQRFFNGQIALNYIF